MKPPFPLREAHAHVLWHGRALSMLDLSGCGSVRECLDLVAGRTGGTAREGAWVVAHGARVEAWAERRWPTRGELDAVAGGRACCLMSFDYHAAVANTAALSAAGLLAGPGPNGGVIARDRAGEPTGVLLETAAHAAWGAAPPATAAEERGFAESALADFARLGFVEVHDLLSPPALGPMLADMDRAGRLPVAVRLFAPVAEGEAATAAAAEWGRERVSLAGLKLFADGTLNSRTAWMLHPYADPMPGMETGKVVAGPAEIEAAVAKAEGLGLPLATHAIGDGAVRAVLDAIERRGSGRGRRGAIRHRVEHLEVVDEADISRFAELGVVASVQPCHLLPDIDVLRRSLPHRLDRVLPLRELLDAGLVPGETLIFGSDAPIVRPDPGDSVRAAIDRGRGDGVTIGEGQALTEAEAWAGFALG